MSIPCTGREKGISTLILGLQIFNKNRRPIKGSPMKLTLKKHCEAFGETLADMFNYYYVPTHFGYIQIFCERLPSLCTKLHPCISTK